MNRFVAIVAGALLGILALQTGCSRQSWDDAASTSAKRVAIVPFRPSGGAESGQYALLLSNFSSVLATQFGAVSQWQVMENERLDALESEQALEIPAAVESPAPANQEGDAAATGAAQWAAVFPSSDYVLLGQINGFDIRPVDARSGGATLARRENRVQSRIDVRIVDVRTRAWLASRSVLIDERLPDDSAAETHINQAMSLAARKVVNAVLLAVAEKFDVTEVSGGAAGQIARLDGGTHQGVEVGQVFRLVGGSPTASAAQVQIAEVLPDYALAKVIQGKAAVGDRAIAQPVESASTVAAATEGAEPRIAVGRFFLAGSDPETYIGGPLVDQIKQELLLNFHRYSGLRVVEDRNDNIKEVLSQQMLEDLSKGRDPGLPMGSLHGVDYLIFGSIGALDMVEGRREVTQMFGATLETEIPAQALFDATVYILDVSRGEYVTAGSLSLDADLRGQTAPRALANVARDIAADMFSKTMLQIRPLSVVEARQNDVVLNHTSAVGLAVGDRFTAMSRGEDRLDPNTKTWMRNVGGQRLGEIEIASFDAGGWAHARLVDGTLPPAGALLMRTERATGRETQPSRKVTWN